MMLCALVPPAIATGAPSMNWCRVGWRRSRSPEREPVRSPARRQSLNCDPRCIKVVVMLRCGHATMIRMPTIAQAPGA
jgi:hypothetical protein